MPNPDLSTAQKIKTGFYLVFTLLAFSSIEIITNPVRHDLPPLLMNFWRFAVGITVLLPALLWSNCRQIREMPAGELLRLGLLGFLNIIVAMGAFAFCIKYSKASTAAIIISANPLATNFFAWLLLREPMPPRRILALALGMFGIIMLTTRADNSVDTPFGLAAGLFAMAGFGLYTVLSKKAIQRHGSLVVLVLSCLPALIAYLPILYFSDAGFWPPEHTWPNILGAGIIGTGLGYLTFMKALEFLSAGRTSYLFFFKPPVAMFFAWLLLGEQIAPSAILGTLLIMAGILSEIWRGSSPAPEPEAQ